MSDEPERLFSRAKKTVTDTRSSLAPETVQALECIKSWSHQRVGGPWTRFEGIGEAEEAGEDEDDKVDELYD